MEQADIASKKQAHYRESIEQGLANIYKKQENLVDKTNFIDALNYTLLAGGKRIRPLLLLLFGEISALQNKQEYSIEHLMPAALSIEMIHTYSLIHDDLPAMDDDDLRRGRPTCHKAYNEATAILTGDALLTDAFSILTNANFPPENILMAVRTLSQRAGSKGMVAGQILDLAMENSDEYNLNQDTIDKKSIHSLIEMNARKTGDLLIAACTLPALLYGCDEKFYKECEEFAIHFGLAFQITDDMLDIVGETSTMGKPKGSDIEKEKTTWVSLLSFDKAKEKALEHIEKANAILLKWKNFTDEENSSILILQKILSSLSNRTH